MRKNLERIQDKYLELRNVNVSSLYEDAPSTPVEATKTSVESHEPSVAEEETSKPFTPADLEALRHSVIAKLECGNQSITPCGLG